MGEGWRRKESDCLLGTSSPNRRGLWKEPVDISEYKEALLREGG